MICRANAPIFSPMINSNIDKILDLYDCKKRKFYSHEEIIQNFGQGITFPDYCSILAAIPQKWKIILRTEGLEAPLDIEPLYETLSLSSSPTRKVYWMLIERNYSIEHRLQALCSIWGTDLKIHLTQNELCDLLINFMTMIKPVKLRFFQYRIMNRSLTTNVN